MAIYTGREDMTLIYPGLAPSNVSKDAKYSIRSGREGYEVQLLYRVSSRERALLAHDGHQELVAMVNKVKKQVAGAPGGAFYINEFSDVLVPGPDGCYFAGIYEDVLEFDFDGVAVSPAATGLQPGEEWTGPHVGIRYTLMAGGKDIKYELKDGRATREHRLSDTAGEVAAQNLAKRLAAVKGSGGGRIYINECGNFFSPPPDGGIDHVFLGSLDEDPWFVPPDVPGRR